VSSYREYPPPYARPERSRPDRPAEVETRRSNAAIPVAVAVILAGLFLAPYSDLAPAVLGVVLLLAGISFLSTRLNPLSSKFYLTRKPSWAAIGVVLLGGLALVSVAYSLWAKSVGSFVPRL
jgi:ABC-type uncharacterized transport system permease subunit